MIYFHPTSIWQLERTEAWLLKKQQQGLQLQRLIGPLYQFAPKRGQHGAYWIEFYDTGSQDGSANLFLEGFGGEEIPTILSSYSIFRYAPTAQREEQLIPWRKDRYVHARTAMVQRLLCTVLLAVILVWRYSSFVMSALGLLCMALLLLYILYNILGLSQVQGHLGE